MRKPIEITKQSAANLAKWRIQEMLNKESNFLRKIALKAALAPGGGVDEIANVLYGMGLRLTIDENDPSHKSWVDGGSVILEPGE